MHLCADPVWNTLIRTLHLPSAALIAAQASNQELPRVFKQTYSLQSQLIPQ